MDFIRMPATPGFSPESKLIEEPTLDDFLDAYRQTGMEVLVGGFREGNKACPMATLVLANVGEKGSIRFPEHVTMYYLHGFGEGFDGKVKASQGNLLKASQRDYDRGYALGQKVRAAIDAGALTDIPDFPPESEHRYLLSNEVPAKTSVS